MNISGRRLFRLSLFSAMVSLSATFTQAQQQWTAPTPEELSMTAQPQVPGAAAVYLFREETTDDKLHMFSIYTRLKVLTERGKEYSNVELSYARGSGGGGLTVEEIQGRTIHPDGAIIPFTGKPYEKLIEKTQGVKVMAKVFSLPDVEVGSIIEYRYKLREDDRYFSAPDWYIQSNLFTRNAHYQWQPTDHELITNDDRGQLTNAISWTPILPPNTELKQTRLPPHEIGHDGQLIFDLNVHDIPPAPNEDFMPPIAGLTYRVLFFYTPYRSGEEFWKSESKHWAKLRDKFIGPGPAVTAAVHDLTLPTDTPDQKLRKLYAAVMKLENTSYTREHSNVEEKAQGFKEVRNTDDIWERKRGNNDQITDLFVAMARAAGMKAYVGRVTNRDRNLFLKAYLSLSQLNDDIAIVNLDGKEQFFDPGSRFCPYQHLEWKHTQSAGIRQSDAGGEIFQTAGESYNFSRTLRVADLTMDQEGAVTGAIKMTYLGAPGLRWRQRMLEGDPESLNRELRTSVERLVPSSLELKVTSIDKLEDYEQPLIANLEVKGRLGSSTGKRLLIPADIFEANSKPAFPHEKREIPVSFSYPRMSQDVVRIKFPPTCTIESLPTAGQLNFQKFAAYGLKTESTPTSFTLRRDYVLGEVLFMPTEYAELRSFYSKFENKDQESVVLTTAPVAAKATPPGN
jgi:Domain of Unknown Function with PDB structure (DUF3857)/Transglutaminase-like superfamily